MRFLSLAILIVIGSAACAPLVVDPEFSPYVTTNEGVTVQFGRMHAENRAGECIKLDFNPNIVTINREEWTRASKKQKQWLINHELGHCRDGLDHNNTLQNNGCPQSVMFWRIPEDKCILDSGMPKIVPAPNNK